MNKSKLNYIRNGFYGLMVMGAVIYVGCSEVKFSSQHGDGGGGNPTQQCNDVAAEYGNGTCEEQGGSLNYHFSFSVGRMDILFVDDNSGSMYVEQTNMANRFPNLLNKISGLDYQISIITTDISASPGNNISSHASFQDGKFLSFPNGDTIISSLTSNVDQMFRSTIQRPETLDCDTSLVTNCPSGDERGIYALNMALDRNDPHFFRKDSHLAVVILSDEDERSNGGQISGYPLETYDLPLTFAQKVHAQLGVGKTVSVHSVIIAPDDTNCLNIQNNQPNVHGYYGYQYARLVNASQDNELKTAHSGFLPGHMGSICASDYGAQLGDIGSLAAVNANIKILPCIPDADKISVSYSPAPSQPISYAVNSDRLLTFSPQPPPGTTVNVDVICPK